MRVFEAVGTVRTARLGLTLRRGLATRQRHFLLTGIILVAGLGIGGASSEAQTARSGGDNARAMQELQQLAAERTALQADNAKLKDQAADLKKKLDQATTENAAAIARGKALEVAAARGAESTKENADALAKSRAQMQELIAKFRETAEN